MPTRHEIPSPNTPDADVAVGRNGVARTAGAAEKRDGGRLEIAAGTMADARRLRSFPSYGFIAYFLSRRQAESPAGSYDLIVRADAVDSDLDYMSRPEDLGYDPERLYRQPRGRLLHQLGPQCYEPRLVPNPEFIQYLPEQAPDGSRNHAVGFYLNPRLDRQMSLFVDMVDEISAARLNFAAKTLNRRREIGRLADTPVPQLRTEGLVITASSANADKVLKIILKNYRRSPGIFAGRPTPALAIRLAPGIAAGTRLNLNNGGGKESFNASRAKLLDETLRRLGNHDFLPSGASPGERHLEVFRRKLQETALDWKIDPGNLAFEKR